MKSLIDIAALIIFILITSVSRADCNFSDLNDYTNVDDYKTPSNIHELLTSKKILPRKTRDELRTEFSNFKLKYRSTNDYYNGDVYPLINDRHRCISDGVASINYYIDEGFLDNNTYPSSIHYCLTFENKISTKKLNDIFYKKYGGRKHEYDKEDITWYYFSFVKDNEYASASIEIGSGNNEYPSYIFIEHRDTTYFAKKQLECEAESENSWESQKNKI